MREKRPCGILKPFLFSTWDILMILFDEYFPNGVAEKNPYLENPPPQLEVSDSFDIWRACKDYWGGQLKDLIKGRISVPLTERYTRFVRKKTKVM